MTVKPPPLTQAPVPARTQLPTGALAVMALVGFIIIATETMPAGLLPQIAAGLDVSEGAAGQFVSVYALGTVLAAIPAITATRGMRRKPLLLIGVLGFLVTNTITALAPNLAVALVARFIAGAFSGLLWGMLAGYARRIAPPEQAGRALAIAMTGTPVALAAGTPLGSWIGTTFEWRVSFWAMSIASVVAVVLALALVPDAEGQSASSRLPLSRVLALPGVGIVLVVVFAWMLAHNLVYTYITAYLRAADVNLSADVALAAVGVAALAGIAATGMLIDRIPRALVLASITLFIVAGTLFLAGSHSRPAVLIAIVLWGVAFGGSATQLQTAISRAGGENADVSNSLLTVSFNLAIFAAGALGAVLVDVYGALSLPLMMILLATASLIVVIFPGRNAFPAAGGTAHTEEHSSTIGQR